MRIPSMSNTSHGGNTMYEFFLNEIVALKIFNFEPGFVYECALPKKTTYDSRD